MNIISQWRIHMNRCVPSKPRKLELMGEHNCPRWHRDSYIGRGIISYNLSGTQYIAEVSVQKQHASSEYTYKCKHA